MLEIYNNTIHDLLSPNFKVAFKKDAIRHDSNGYTRVEGLKVIDVLGRDEVMSLLNKALQNR